MKNKNSWNRTAACIALLAVLAACSKKAETARPAESILDAAAPAVMAKMVESDVAAPPKLAGPPPPPPAMEAQTANVLTAATTAQQMGSSATTFVSGERKFIRTANVRFGVKDVYIAALGIEDTVANHGGFVVKNDISAETVRAEEHPAGEGKVMELKTYTLNGHLIVRVPSAKTQEFLRAIAGHIVFLDNRSFSARDAQFDMLREQLAQIRNQEAQNDLGQALGEGGKLAHKTEAVAARNESKAARDAANVARKEFEDQVAFSTIELTLYQPSKLVATERVDMEALYRKARPGFFQRLGDAFRGGWYGLLGVAVELAGIWPMLVVVAVVGFLLLRAKRRWRLKAARAETQG